MAKQADPNLLRCLAIRQPWAWAVCTGIKTVENRTQSTPHVGQDIAILASTTKTRLGQLVTRYPDLALDADFFRFGAIIGVVRLAGVTEMNPELESNPSAVGPYCWLIENPRLLPRPIPSRGKQNLLYHLTAEETNAVRSQLANLPQHPLTEDGEAWATAYKASELTDRGWHYRRARQWTVAVARFDEALALYPRELIAMLGKAECLLESNALATLIQDCGEFLETDPEDVLALMLRRAAFLRQGATEAAEADYAQAIAIDAEDAEFVEALLAGGGAAQESEEGE